MNKEIESRRVSVERLAIEGNSQEDIADILEVPLRTVERDIAAIREANVLARDEKSVAAQVIRLIARAEGRMGGLLRRADKKDCPYPQQIDAEWKAWLVARGLVQDLRALGYLPNAAKEVRADVTHHVSRQATTEETRARIAEFERAMKEVGFENEAARKEIEAIKGEIAVEENQMSKCK